jgi:hypothetical protein
MQAWLEKRTILPNGRNWIPVELNGEQTGTRKEKGGATN